MSRQRFLALVRPLAVASLLGISAGQALADLLPNAMLYVRAQSGSNYLYRGPTSATTSLSDAGGFAYASSSSYVNAGTTPSLGVTSSATGVDTGYTSVAMSGAQYTYYFMVSDPSLSGAVPVNVSYDISYSGTKLGSPGTWGGTAELRIADGGILGKCLTVGSFTTSMYSTATTNTTAGGHLDTINVSPNNWTKVYIGIWSQVNANYSGNSGDFTMLLDPTLTVDANWLQAHPESHPQIEFITATPVPEPAAGVLLACGLVGLLRLRRRRK